MWKYYARYKNRPRQMTYREWSTMIDKKYNSEHPPMYRSALISVLFIFVSLLKVYKHH